MGESKKRERMIPTPLPFFNMQKFNFFCRYTPLGVKGNAREKWRAPLPRLKNFFFDVIGLFTLFKK